MNNEPIWMDMMLNPETYAHQVKDIELIQTHISWVFITDTFVYKIKKPVNFGFLDFTSLDKRHFFCNEELRLNKRLCPDTYIDVIPITQKDSTIALNGSGTPIEWVLVMKYMPHENMMSKIIKNDLFTEKHLDSITDKLVPFYKTAQASPKDAQEFGSLETIKFNNKENFDQTRAFIGELISEDTYKKILEYTTRFQEDNSDLFSRRVAENHIVDGHGDLHSGNICFDKDLKDVYIFDCIEFNNRFRFGDIAVDIAFLSMDLDYYGLCLLSKKFEGDLIKNLEDPDLELLLNFYKCYRAYVRFKIGCFTWASPEVDSETKKKAYNQANKYAKLALYYTGNSPSPNLYIFFGLTGTGKSTIARALSEKLDTLYFNSDTIRKELAGIKPNTKITVPYEHGLYSSEMTQRTYNALMRRAASNLITGQDVILDATYTSSKNREQLLELCNYLNIKPTFIYCYTEEDVLKQRLDKRENMEGQESDGRWEIYLRQKAMFAPIDNLTTECNLIKLNTNTTLDKALDILSSALTLH